MKVKNIHPEAQICGINAGDEGYINKAQQCVFHKYWLTEAPEPPKATKSKAKSNAKG